MKLQLKVPNMTCGGGVSSITQAISAIVQGDPQTKMVSVETQAPETAVKAALSKAGYPASQLDVRGSDFNFRASHWMFNFSDYRRDRDPIKMFIVRGTLL